MVLFAAVAVVGQHPGGGIVHIAACPLLVGHPEIHDHLTLTGIVFLEYLPIEQRLLGEGGGVGILFPLFFKFGIGVVIGSIFLQVIHHGMSNRIGKGSLFPPENIVGEIVSLKGMAQQIFAFAVDIALLLRIHAHHIPHKLQIAKGHPCLQ